MLHVTKDEKAFGRFGSEILLANPNLKNISFIGLYLEFAIFTGLKTMIPGLHRLIGVSHLMKWDESKLAGLLPKTGQNIADRKLSLSEIIKDIYWSRVANFYVWYCWSNRSRRFQRQIGFAWGSMGSTLLRISPMVRSKWNISLPRKRHPICKAQFRLHWTLLSK